MSEIKKRKYKCPNYPTPKHHIMPEGPNGMTYADHLDKQRKKEGLPPLNEVQKRQVNYRGHVSKYDL